MGDIILGGHVKSSAQNQSDHHPILVTTSSTQLSGQGICPFHSLISWHSHKDFSNFLHDAWPIDMDLPTCLSLFRDHINKWNKTVFRSIYTYKTRILARINSI